jgi:hypothetical protein
LPAVEIGAVIGERQSDVTHGSKNKPLPGIARKGFLGLMIRW